jgi:hypothetical protein
MKRYERKSPAAERGAEEKVGVLEEQLASLRVPVVPSFGHVSQTWLNHICEAVSDWLDSAGDSKRELALEALQVTVEAEVTLETTTPSSPGGLRPVGNERYVHVVMPMFVQW